MTRRFTYMRKYAKPEKMEPELAQYAVLLVWAKTSKIKTEKKRHKWQTTFSALCSVQLWALLLVSEEANTVTTLPGSFATWSNGNALC